MIITVFLLLLAIHFRDEGVAGVKESINSITSSPASVMPALLSVQSPEEHATVSGTSSGIASKKEPAEQTSNANAVVYGVISFLLVYMLSLMTVSVQYIILKIKYAEKNRILE